MKQLQTYSALLPGIGLIIYIFVFTWAAMHYPGGSENIPTAEGYSFFHNFLCDAMNPVTHGGHINPARNLAVVSHLIMSFSMIGFFFILPSIFPWSNFRTRMVRYAGMLTMTVFIFMSTTYHDEIVVATAIGGTIALVPFFMELRKLPAGFLSLIAYLCFILSVVVFVIFQTRFGFYYLPFLQKIAFFLDAGWVIAVCVLVYKRKTSSKEMTALNSEKLLAK